MINEAMRAHGAEGSKVREISSLARERREQIGDERVFDFSLGCPSVRPPLSVRAAIDRALEELPPEELHGYTSALGLPRARIAVAEALNDEFHTSYGMNDICMTAGASASVCCALHALTRPGEDVIVVSPYFPEYKVWIETCGCRCSEAPAKPYTFRLSVGGVMSSITRKTAAVIVASPNNPTGCVYGRDELQRLANCLHEVNATREEPIYLIADESYRDLAYGVEVPWVPGIYPHTVVCHSYSVSLSIPGERVGWTLVPPACHGAPQVMEALAGAARALGFVRAPVLFQHVVAACARDRCDVSAYDRNRTCLVNALGEMGYSFVEPRGAFFLWIRSLEPDAEAFCERARTYELFLVPSDDFGVGGWARVGYCVGYETIVDSLPAWQALMDEYRS